MDATLRRKTPRALLFALVAIGSAALYAQRPSEPRPGPGQPVPVAPPQITVNKPVTPEAATPAQADQTIATMLAIANEEEVALGQIVEAKAQNANVRAFAERMVKDHAAFLETLRRFGGEPGFTDTGASYGNAGQPRINITGPRAAPERPGQEPAATPRPRLQVDVQIGGNRPGQLDFVAIKRQIAESCLASARKDFEAADVHEAELEYVGAQVAMHKQMLEALKVVRPFASAELQSAIDQATQVTSAHLEHARTLLTSLVQEAVPGGRTATGR